MNWRVALAIAQKDLWDAVKNYYILFTLVSPIVLSVFFRILMPNPMAIASMTVAIYDPGKSRLVSGLRLNLLIKLVEADSEQALKEKVAGDRDLSAGLMVPEGFDAAVDAGEFPELVVYYNKNYARLGTSSLPYQLNQQLWAMIQQRLPAKVTWTDLSRPDEASTEAFNMKHYILILMLMMGLVMPGMLVVPLLLVEEKEKYTLEALLVSPGGPAEIALGKGLVGLAYSLMIACIILTLNDGWVGDWPLTLLTVTLGSLFLVGIGLLMGGILHTTNQVNTWSMTIATVLMLTPVGGFFNAPAWADVLMRITPTYYMAKAITVALAGDATLERVWGSLAILVGCAAAAFVVLVWRLRRERK